MDGWMDGYIDRCKSGLSGSSHLEDVVVAPRDVEQELTHDDPPLVLRKLVPEQLLPQHRELRAKLVLPGIVVHVSSSCRRIRRRRGLAIAALLHASPSRHLLKVPPPLFNRSNRFRIVRCRAAWVTSSVEGRDSKDRAEDLCFRDGFLSKLDTPKYMDSIQARRGGVPVASDVGVQEEERTGYGDGIHPNRGIPVMRSPVPKKRAFALPCHFICPAALPPSSSSA